MSFQRTASGQKQEAAYHINRAGKQIHHGRTPAAWAGTMTATGAFLVGGIGLVLQLWPMFWVGVGLLVAALVVTLVLQKMGFGAY